MLVETVVRALTLCIAGVFAVAVVHKAGVLARGEAASAPVIKALGLHGARGALALAAAAAIELAVIVGLLVVPSVGCFAAALLLLVYTLELRRLAPGESCQCFGEVFSSSTRREATWRNLLMACAALLSGIAYVLVGLAVAPLSQASIGIALIVLAGAAGVEALQSQVSRQSFGNSGASEGFD